MIKLKLNRRWTDADRAQMVSLLEAGTPIAKVASKLMRTEGAVKVQATLSRVSYSLNVNQRDCRNQRLRPCRQAVAPQKDPAGKQATEAATGRLGGFDQT